MRHSHSLNSLKYLVDQVHNITLCGRSSHELTNSFQDDKASLRTLLTEITREDPLSDLDEEIVFAPPEGSDEDDEFFDDGPTRLRRLHPARIPQRHSLPHHTLSAGSSSKPRRQLSVTDAHSLRRQLSNNTRSSMAVPQRNSAEGHSLASLSRRMSSSSLYSLNLEAPPLDAFQQRRKRAAKLTKFFGTDYRSIFGEVLETIEVGVMDDQTRGTLTEDEAAVSSDCLIPFVWLS